MLESDAERIENEEYPEDYATLEADEEELEMYAMWREEEEEQERLRIEDAEASQ